MLLTSDVTLMSNHLVFPTELSHAILLIMLSLFGMGVSKVNKHE